MDDGWMDGTQFGSRIMLDKGKASCLISLLCYTSISTVLDRSIDATTRRKDNLPVQGVRFCAGGS